MAAYPLNKLLNLRHDREARARRDVVTQRAAIAEQQALVEAAEQALTNFTAWRVGEEQRLFAEVREQALKSADLDVLKHEIAALRQRQAEKKQQLDDARRRLNEAEALLEQRLEVLREAQHNRRKLEGHMDLWAQADRLEQARHMEREAEEVLSMLPGQAPHQGGAS